VCVCACVGLVQGLRTVYLNVTLIHLVLLGFWALPNFQYQEWITKSRKNIVAALMSQGLLAPTSWILYS